MTDPERGGRGVTRDDGDGLEPASGLVGLDLWQIGRAQIGCVLCLEMVQFAACSFSGYRRKTAHSEIPFLWEIDLFQGTLR